MNEIMKYGAMAIGGYVLYNWLKNASFMQSSQFPVMPLASNIQPNVTGANNITQVAPDARTKILNYVGSGDGQNTAAYAQWALYYHAATNGYAPAFVDSIMGRNGIPAGTPLTLDQFLATAKLNGMNGVSGMGFLTRPSYFEANLVR